MELTNLQLQELYKTLNQWMFDIQSVEIIDNFFKKFEKSVIKFEEETNKILEDNSKEQWEINDNTNLSNEEKQKEFMIIKDKYQKIWNDLSTEKIEVDINSFNEIYKILKKAWFIIKWRRWILLFSEMLKNI